MYNHKRSTVNPGVFEIIGPGLNYHGTYPAMNGDDYLAEKVCSMLAKAHTAGQEARAKEIRTALGIRETAWGVKFGD